MEENYTFSNWEHLLYLSQKKTKKMKWLNENNYRKEKKRRKRGERERMISSLKVFLISIFFSYLRNNPIDLGIVI